MQVSSPRAVVDADKCRFINVAPDDVAAAIAGTQLTLREGALLGSWSEGGSNSKKNTRSPISRLRWTVSSSP
jgi:hypothetical protein